MSMTVSFEDYSQIVTFTEAIWLEEKAKHKSLTEWLMVELVSFKFRELTITIELMHGMKIKSPRKVLTLINVQEV